MWMGVEGPVPLGQSSEWAIFSLLGWERSGQCPVLSLKIVYLDLSCVQVIWFSMTSRLVRYHLIMVYNYYLSKLK